MANEGNGGSGRGYGGRSLKEVGGSVSGAAPFGEMAPRAQELLLTRTALEKGWHIRPELREKVIRMCEECLDDAESSRRERNSAMKILALVDNINVRREANDLKAEAQAKPAAATVNVFTQVNEYHSVFKDTVVNTEPHQPEPPPAAPADQPARAAEPNAPGEG